MLCVFIRIASPFNINKKITLKYPKYAVTGFFQGTQEGVRNSRGKRAICVRGTVVLCLMFFVIFDSDRVDAFVDLFSGCGWFGWLAK